MKRIIRARQLLLICGDIISYYFALIIAIILGFQKLPNYNLILSHLIPFSFFLPFWIILVFLFDLYRLEKISNFYFLILRIIFSIFSGLVISSIIFYLIPLGITPKTNLLIFGLTFGLLLYLWRFIFIKLFGKHFKKNLLVIGEGKEIEKFVSTIQNSPHLGYSLVAVLNPHQEKIIKNYIAQKKINIIIADTKNLPDNFQKTLFLMCSQGIDFWDFAYAYEFIFQKIPLNYIDYAWFLNNLKEGEKILTDKLKRLIDIILAIFFILIFLPVAIIIMILIKLEDGGPIFYKQKRVGKNLKEFYILKFRSMIPKAEKSVVMWAQENDPRITKVGKIIRKMHFDELPQMINILKGELSFVGPRPERPEFVKELEKEIPFYNLRHIIRPGFTGWAQIKFRYARSINDSFQKLEYDLYYIKNRSLFLDLYILLKTASLLFRE